MLLARVNAPLGVGVHTWAGPSWFLFTLMIKLFCFLNQVTPSSELSIYHFFKGVGADLECQTHAVSECSECSCTCSSTGWIKNYLGPRPNVTCDLSGVHTTVIFQHKLWLLANWFPLLYYIFVAVPTWKPLSSGNTHQETLMGPISAHVNMHVIWR